MDHLAANLRAENYSSPGEFPSGDGEDLATSVRTNFSALAEALSRLGDLYGESIKGAHARKAAAAARRARILADLLP
jgi:hypothetical protein